MGPTARFAFFMFPITQPGLPTARCDEFRPGINLIFRFYTRALWTW